MMGQSQPEHPEQEECKCEGPEAGTNLDQGKVAGRGPVFQDKDWHLDYS